MNVFICIYVCVLFIHVIVDDARNFLLCVVICLAYL